jgi:tetratricopeptide (TPR) repeat protein
MVLATSLFVSPASAESRDDWTKCLSALKVPPEERIARCTAVLERGSDALINTSTAYFNRGHAYMAKEDFDHAIADFSKVIHFYPDAAYGYAARATAYFRHRDFDQAIADGTRMIELDPKSGSGYLCRGQAYEAMGDLDRAIADYDKLADIDPKFAGAYHLRGHAYAAKGDVENALANYNKAIELAPKFKAPYLGRASLYKDRGDFERALADYDLVIQLDPKNGRAFRERGVGDFQAGLLAKSLDDLNQSITLNPKDPYTVLWLDIVAKRSKIASRIAELSAELDMTKWPAPVVRLFQGETTSDAVFAAADDADAWTKKGQVCEANFYLGELALQRGDKEEAARLFRLATDDCPKTFIERSAASLELKAMAANP